ncbi:MAG: hypothetical protein K9H48_20995 [Melioribacteraceae bacterium]|nr:hypothetical protein [Saprospiraceae bacterium]MCF8356929.1 hypothetical protein [Melioribacteraceae bacterium]MCF8396326.1 hypothetical protein [Melioribacteraceae bacterium]
MKTYKYKILLVVCFQLLFLTEGFCQSTKTEKRNQLIAELNNLKELPADTVFDTFNSADAFVQNGDTLVLSALFNLTFKSDGYISASVGSILENLFLQKTDFFLS